MRIILSIFLFLLVNVTTWAKTITPASNAPTILLRKPSMKHFYNTVKLSFSWDSGGRERRYYFIIAEDKAMTKILVRKKVEDHFFLFHVNPAKLNEEQYYYVKVFSEDYRMSSNLQGFKIRGEKVKFKNIGVFYTVSNGVFTDKSIKSSGSLTEQQNSPATLGIFYTIPTEGSLSYSFSAYGSYYNSIKVKNTGKTLTIPPELGGTSAINYSRPGSSFAYSIGMDFERFSAFNTYEYIQFYEDEKTVRQDMWFASLGVAHFREVFSRVLYMKLSLSNSVANYGEKSPLLGTNYSGYKYMIYGQYNILERIYLHGFYKYHSLTGPTNLEVVRIGAGIGYKF